ncbi:hypothetical protein F4678DRAFT_266261 [Xylaria arbuscula]|nr:hypothetical protein F4678DRAFT_266261 [Xylaria arbuscula]
MSSSPIAKTLIRSSARAASRNGGGIPQLRRTYATEQPSMPAGNNRGGRPRMLAALLALPVLAYILIPSKPAKQAPSTQAAAAAATKSPNLDPAARKRERAANEPDERKYMYPEHKNPEEFRPAFGQLHKQKRVDTPPDGKHHQALNDRARDL